MYRRFGLSFAKMSHTFGRASQPSHNNSNLPFIFWGVTDHDGRVLSKGFGTRKERCEEKARKHGAFTNFSVHPLYIPRDSNGWRLENPRARFDTERCTGTVCKTPIHCLQNNPTQPPVKSTTGNTQVVDSQPQTSVFTLNLSRQPHRRYRQHWQPCPHGASR